MKIKYEKYSDEYFESYHNYKPTFTKIDPTWVENILTITENKNIQANKCYACIGIS